MANEAPVPVRDWQEEGRRVCLKCGGEAMRLRWVEDSQLLQVNCFNCACGWWMRPKDKPQAPQV
jgi:hypothetical protein